MSFDPSPGLQLAFPLPTLFGPTQSISVNGREVVARSDVMAITLTSGLSGRRSMATTFPRQVGEPQGLFDSAVFLAPWSLPTASLSAGFRDLGWPPKDTARKL
ncbi:hypothetical protein L227DRAFT_576890 [Lentinus tigrinus ALCF2SS1-6]|uniref:Uncharacterized protein n=1 Tax=Lentinus tigrinus ALCF2SS1-6 TaxID=1328759 RepID=A0A5C2S563_9APHY|nr:hypothetical protein L227DRAFT_576890 [Lentinus tigrinus ALCF2SS1-6]